MALPERYSDGLKVLTAYMLQSEPVDRPDAADLLGEAQAAYNAWTAEGGEDVVSHYTESDLEN